MLAALESELGVRLFQRTTRRVTITEAGRRYLERCREVESLVDEAEAELRAEQSEPRGRLAITAPVLFGERHVVSGVAAFLERYPNVTAEVHLFDRVAWNLDAGTDQVVSPLASLELVHGAVRGSDRRTPAFPSPRPCERSSFDSRTARPAFRRTRTFKTSARERHYLSQNRCPD